MASAVAALPAAGDVREFFSQLQVSRAPSGNVIIEAPPEAASTLGALFEGMAALLQSVAGKQMRNAASFCSPGMTQWMRFSFCVLSLCGFAILREILWFPDHHGFAPHDRRQRLANAAL